MAATYDLSSDFKSGDNLRTQVPYWVVGVARYANPVTWDPVARASKDENDTFVVSERPHLALTGDVYQVRTTAAKEAHVANMTLTLYPTSNYLTDILPGDWVVCCMVNSEAHGKTVLARMKNREPVNGFRDGLKFMGKVATVRRSTARAQNGTLSTQYSIQCVGFAEFDSLVFFHPQLQQANILPAQLEQFGTLIQDIVDGSDSSVSGGTVDINLVLPKLIETIFGVGAWSGAPTADIDGKTVSASPNSRYLVPETVARWLGLSAKTYNGLLKVMLGIQHYRGVQRATEATTETPWKLFQPDGPKPMMGWFPLSPPPTQASVWDILSTYSNPPLNEMYITLRADENGQVLPHFIVRQTPYSTAQVRGALAQHKAEADGAGTAMATERAMEGLKHPLSNFDQPSVSGVLKPAYMPEAGIEADATEFLELPRWKLTGDMLYSMDIGRSDALRFNMVHVSGTGYGSLTDEIGSFVRARPVQDNADIKRNGVRPYMTGVNCVLRDLARGPKVWRDIMADIVMGQHLTLTGSFTCVGIQAPIAVGDNVEYEGLVFHIEAVQHMAGCVANGARDFRTVLMVSHGIEGDLRQAMKEQLGEDERSARFAGSDLSEQDMAGRVPVTVER